MAFNQPVDADRPDDPGLVSAFVRAPVLGTLMWILGGNVATDKIKEEEESKSDSSSVCDQTITEELVREDIEDPSTLPNRLCSEVSEPDYLSSMNTENQDLIECKKKLRASWSDESGQSLVEYLDETTSHEPLSSLHAQPVRSAIRRSGAMYSNPSTSQNNRQFGIPSCISDKGSVNTNVPNQECPGGLKAGTCSPQWGWYVSTTPPINDMYVNKSGKNTNISPQIPNTLTSYPLGDSHFRKQTHHPVFTKGVPHDFQNGNTGWPSLPL